MYAGCKAEGMSMVVPPRASSVTDFFAKAAEQGPKPMIGSMVIWIPHCTILQVTIGSERGEVVRHVVFSCAPANWCNALLPPWGSHTVPESSQGPLLRLKAMESCPVKYPWPPALRCRSQLRPRMVVEGGYCNRKMAWRFVCSECSLMIFTVAANGHTVEVCSTHPCPVQMRMCLYHGQEPLRVPRSTYLRSTTSGSRIGLFA